MGSPPTSPPLAPTGHPGALPPLRVPIRDANSPGAPMGQEPLHSPPHLSSGSATPSSSSFSSASGSLMASSSPRLGPHSGSPTPGDIEDLSGLRGPCCPPTSPSLPTPGPPPAADGGTDEVRAQVIPVALGTGVAEPVPSEGPQLHWVRYQLAELAGGGRVVLARPHPGAAIDPGATVPITHPKRLMEPP